MSLNPDFDLIQAPIAPTERRPSRYEGYCSCGQIAQHVCDSCVRWTCADDLVECEDRTCRARLCRDHAHRDEDGWWCEAHRETGSDKCIYVLPDGTRGECGLEVTA